MNNKNIKLRKRRENEMRTKSNKGVTLISLVITIVLNFSYLEMARMNRFEKI